MITFATTSLATPALHFDDVRLPSGVRMHFAQQGPQTGPALLLLHGFTDSWFSFSRVLPLFRPEMRVVAPDLRGHGDSTRVAASETGTGGPAWGYRTTDLADDVVSLMNALRIPSAVVLGHSMGAFVARQVAALAEARVPRLIMMGAGPSTRTPVLHAFQAEVNAQSDPVDPAFVREFQESTVHQPMTPSFMEAAIANSLRMPAAIWKAALAGLIADEAPKARLLSRTLVLGGREDKIFGPSEHISLARQFPKGELELVEGVGHALHWENPARFMSALVRFGV